MELTRNGEKVFYQRMQMISKKKMGCESRKRMKKIRMIKMKIAEETRYRLLYQLQKTHQKTYNRIDINE